MAISKKYAKVEEGQFQSATAGANIMGLAGAFIGVSGYFFYKKDKDFSIPLLITGVIIGIGGAILYHKNKPEFKPEFIDEAGGLPTAEQLEKLNKENKSNLEGSN